MPDARDPIEVFCSYAHADKRWWKKLDTHLSMLERQGLISTWFDRQIIAGTDWKQDLDTHLNRASVILLLISSDFLASDFCYSVEMKRALERHQAGEARVIPILVRPVDWKGAPFAHLQALPTEAKPITTWSNKDTAFADVAAGIRRAIEDLSLLSVNLPQTDFPPIWNIPFARNPFFLGRDDLLARLHTQLQRSQSAAVSQPRSQAISGLGGIGKTHLAVEYAYRFRQEYQAVFWARAEDAEALNASYTTIATLLNLPEKDAQEQARTVQAVKTWLQTHRDWLLILDNADEPDVVLSFLPPALGGHLLLTTRATALEPLAHRLEVETFSLEVGALFVLRRAGIIAPDAELAQASPHDQDLAVQIVQDLGGLPLALDQAGAYLETTGCGLSGYQHLYQQRSADLLREYRGILPEHPPVATTWSLSFQRVEEKNPAAAELLRFCAFLAAAAIPEEIFSRGTSKLGTLLASTAGDAYQFDRAIETLRSYSLIERDPQRKTLAVHRLVQEVERAALPPKTQREWMQQVVLAIHATFPSVQVENWTACERLLPHALQCAIWIEHAHIASSEAVLLLNQTAVYLEARARYEEATSLLQHALKICEHILGSDHPDTTTSLNNLGFLYHVQGKYEEAGPFYQRSLAIRERMLGPDHPDTATSLNNLANLYRDQGKYEEAEPLLQSSVVIYERMLGPDHPDTASGVGNLAYLYTAQGKYKEAEPLYQRALEICERVFPDHPDTASTRNNLADLYMAQGKYEKAEPLYQRTLEICERDLGPDHPDTANSIGALAYLYMTQGKYEKAKPLYQRTLAIFEQVLGLEHPNTAASIGNLASIYERQGKYAEAGPLYRWSLEIHERVLGPNHPRTAASLNNLADLYKAQGKYEEAEPLFQRALAIFEQVLGLEHPDTSYSLNKLADLYSTQGKYEEAEPLYQRALVTREQVLGPDHPVTGSSLNNLAFLYYRQGKYAEAEPLYQRALKICERALGPDHPHTAINLNNLADLYAVQSKYAEAEPLYQRVLTIFERVLGPDHPHTAINLNNLGLLYAEQGKYAEAKTFYQRSLKIFERVLGSDHPDTRGVRANYASLLQRIKLNR